MEEIIDFLFESGQLKNVKRSGWWLAGVKDPESVADHVFRTMLIARILAEEEGGDKDKINLMVLYHDIHEARMNDKHKVAARYIENGNSKHNCIEEQTSKLPGFLKEEVKALFTEANERKTKEALIVNDADLLECAFQAKEYLDTGYKECADWLDNIGKVLVTGTGKEMLKQIKKTNSRQWWHGLKDIKR